MALIKQKKTYLGKLLIVVRLEIVQMNNLRVGLYVCDASGSPRVNKCERAGDVRSAVVRRC